MMIKVTEHAKQRAVERLGFKEETATQKLNALLNGSVEVFHTGQGRAFENKQNGVVIITDVAKNNIVTVYHSKGTEVSIKNKDFIVETNNIGIITDSKLRKIIFENLKDEIRKEAIFDCEISNEISKLDIKFSNIKLKMLKCKNIEIFKELDLQLSEIISDIKLLRKQREEKSKAVNKLRSEVSEVLGLELQAMTDPVTLKREELEKMVKL